MWIDLSCLNVVWWYEWEIMVQCHVFLYIFQYVVKTDCNSQIQEKHESIMAVWAYWITDDTGSIKFYLKAMVKQDLASDRSLVLRDWTFLANNISAISYSPITVPMTHISPSLFFQSYQCFYYIHESSQSWLQPLKAHSGPTPII